MFASPTFPRIPLFGGDAPDSRDLDGGQRKAIAASKTDASSAFSTPPVVPFETLVLSAETMTSKHNDAHKRNAASVAKYDKVVASVSTEEAREFLAALVFLGTRSVSRTTPTPGVQNRSNSFSTAS
jgi:hypothetical protein